MAGPYGQWPELAAQAITAAASEMACKGEDYSEFLICQGLTESREAFCLCVSKETQLW
jgi:hypothetical protein